MNMSNRGNNFDHAIAKVAIAQICESVGFQGFQHFALEIFSDAALRYIHDVGETAHSCANLAGRTQCNAFDIVQALDDLCLGLGFADASDAGHCLASSGTVRDIVTYIGEAEGVPFAYSINCFPVFRDREWTPSFWQIGEEPPHEHIPPWLPAFPESQEYTKKVTEFGGKANSICSDGKDRNGLKREDSLGQEHFDSGRLKRPLSAFRSEVAGAVQTPDCNPFLMVPLQFEESKVSTIGNLSKFSAIIMKKNSDLQDDSFGDRAMLEMFEPGIEVAERELCDSEQIKKDEPFVQRLPIKFKLAIARKSLVLALDSSLRNQDLQKAAPCFLEHL